MKKYYLPDSQNDRVVWLNSFAMKIGNYAPATLTTVTAADATSVQDDAAYYQAVVTMAKNFDDLKQDLTQYLKKLSYAAQGTSLGPFPGVTVMLTTAVEAGIFTRISALVRRIKADPAYTEAIGADLGVIGAEATFDESTAKPQLKLKFTAGSVKIDFNKPRSLDGVKIYSKRGNEDEFTLLAIDTSSPYIDNRPNLEAQQPEKREYKAWFYKDDSITGLESSVESIIVNI